MGRFINADALVSTGKGILGNNMFAYCRSNPVRRKDVHGTTEEDCLTGDDKDDLFTHPDGGYSGSSNSGNDAIIYRYGGTSPGNLTPRASDVNSGLSFSTEYRSGAAKTTIGAVNGTGILCAKQDGRTHVTVTPVNASVKEWYDMGSESIWTTTLKSVVTKAR